MISPSELRLGNWVKYRDDNTTPDFENIEICVQDLFLINNKTENTYYEPILITIEILEKCGFEQIKDHEKGHLKLKIDKFGIDEVELIYYGGSIMLSILSEWVYLEHIIYLHQLQNLYFTLTGEELKINIQ